MPKTSGYVKTFKVNKRDKSKNNNLISFCIDDEKIFEIIKIFGIRLNI